TVLLLQFGKIPVLVKEFGEKGVEAFMEQIGKTFASSIRQNDLAFRYGAASVALVLGETAEKEAFQAAEKLRKLIEEIRIPGKDVALPFHAGIAKPWCARTSTRWTSSPKSSIGPRLPSIPRLLRAMEKSRRWLLLLPAQPSPSNHSHIKI